MFNNILSALGTSGLITFMNIKRLDIKLGKEHQCHITKQLVHSFSVNIRISRIRGKHHYFRGLTNPDVKLKRCINGVMLSH